MSTERDESQDRAIYELLSKLAGVDTSDINLRDHPDAWEAFEGVHVVPTYRGYANLGTGQYLLNVSAIGDEPELIISIASEEEKAGRKVGEDLPNAVGKVVYPEQMAVRLRFSSVDGLAVLERKLSELRYDHFPDAGIDFDKYVKYVDIPTPKPMAGVWTLTAPDGNVYSAESPIRCISAESSARIPPHIALGRIARSIKDDFPDDYEV